MATLPSRVHSTEANRRERIGHSATNPYATHAPAVIGADGQYLGKMSSNPYDPNSTSNPYGKYGSPYSSTSINNPYSKYGSPYSNQLVTNPYATQAPSIYGTPRP